MSKNLQKGKNTPQSLASNRIFTIQRLLEHIPVSFITLAYLARIVPGGQWWGLVPGLWRAQVRNSCRQAPGRYMR